MHIAMSWYSVTYSYYVCSTMYMWLWITSVTGHIMQGCTIIDVFIISMIIKWCLLLWGKKCSLIATRDYQAQSMHMHNTSKNPSSSNDAVAKCYLICQYSYNYNFNFGYNIAIAKSFQCVLYDDRMGYCTAGNFWRLKFSKNKVFGFIISIS